MPHHAFVDRPRRRSYSWIIIRSAEAGRSYQQNRYAVSFHAPLLDIHRLCITFFCRHVTVQYLVRCLTQSKLLFIFASTCSSETAFIQIFYLESVETLSLIVSQYQVKCPTQFRIKAAKTDELKCTDKKFHSRILLRRMMSFSYLLKDQLGNF